MLDNVLTDQRKHQSSASLASNAENVSIWWRHHDGSHCSAVCIIVLRWAVIYTVPYCITCITVLNGLNIILAHLHTVWSTYSLKYVVITSSMMFTVTMPWNCNHISGFTNVIRLIYSIVYERNWIFGLILFWLQYEFLIDIIIDPYIYI